MRTRKMWIWGAAGALVLAALCLLAAGAIYTWARHGVFSSRPLVLIHSPLSQERVEAGETLVVHATARSNEGLARLELWADHRLIAAEDAPADPPSPNLVLTAPWTPRHEGAHLLVARGIASSGAEGQASVTIQLVETGEAEPSGTHTVQEGETLETLAALYGTTPQELADLNPGLGPDGLAPGDSVVVPDLADEPPAGDGGLRAGDSPSAPDSAPGSFADVASFYGVVPLQGLIPGDDTPLGLRVEVLELTTTAAYEGLHCYISLAGQDPRWIPDADDDPSTDESFAPLGPGMWDTSGHLTGDAAPVVGWPGDRPLPAQISCVGVAAGGTDALELGSMTLAIPPEEWDGIPHPSEAAGAEGGFRLVYRVTRQGSAPGGVPLLLDPDMAIPWDVRLDDRRISLRWEYADMGEEPIDGFQIYLNGTLQWAEPYHSRESALPDEWFHPPCDTPYTFGVVAFRLEAGESYESYPGVTVLPAATEHCEREVLITFLTLETFDLGPDGRRGHGDVGPPYGYFFANEGEITFDATPSGRGGSLDLAAGLTDNTTYDLIALSGDSGWRFSGMPALRVEVPEGGTFQFGFHIMDHDTGRCHDADDVGCDDVICGEESFEYRDDGFGTLDRVTEGGLISEDGRCRVTYAFGPAPGSAVGAGLPGAEPLPWIDVEQIVVDEATGDLHIHVRNTGNASWPRRDLEIELQTRSRTSLGTYTWPDFILEPGQRAVLEQPGMTLAPPFDACVVIDPSNAVPEWFERSGAFSHNPICPLLPDLAVTALAYDGPGGGHLRVTVQNIGEAALVDRTILLSGELADGRSAGIYASWPGVSLGPSEIRVFDVAGISDTLREAMHGGYSITVDPDSTIVEADRSNNTFDVRSGAQVRINWQSIRAPYRFRNRVEFFFDAYLVSGSSRRQVADWSALQDIPWDTCDMANTTCSRDFDLGHETPRLDVFGDETLEIVVAATEIETDSFEGDRTYTMVYTPENDWGAGASDPSMGCRHIQPGDPNFYRIEFGMYEGSYRNNAGHWVFYEEPWRLTYHICY